MNRFEPITQILCSALAALLAVCPAAADDGRPNIIVILVDDMGFSDLGCYGGEIDTPNLDALAEGGLRFTQFYNTGRCCPTRASLLTGLYAHQAGIGHMSADDGVPGYRGALNRRCVTLAEVLGPAGYFTAMAGKWHVGEKDGQRPASRGFDRFFGSTAGGVFYDISTMGGKKFYLDDTLYADKDSDLPEDFYSTHAFADYAVQFIDGAREADKPFFLYLAHIAPHFPLQAPQATIEKYRGRYKAGWGRLQDKRHQKQRALGMIDEAWPAAPRPGGVKAWDRLTDAQRDRMDHIMAIYAAVMEEMDKSIGTLVGALRERGELDNTLILFMSDNGGNAESGPMGRLQGGKWLGGPGSKVWCGKGWAWAQNTPFREFKHYVHEGGIATPLIVHWPAGIDPSLNGKWTGEVGHVIDIMATCVDAADAAYPEQQGGRAVTPMQGVSLLPVLAGEPLERGRPLFWEHEGNRAVRDGGWKLVAKGINGPWELYDLTADRTESKDLAAKHPDLAARLAEAWERWAEQSQVYPMPARNLWKRRAKE